MPSYLFPNARKTPEDAPRSEREWYSRVGGGEKELGSEQAASDLLHSLGIPGIKYLDAGSRAGGKGTRNFVVFNPDDVKILERK